MDDKINKILADKDCTSMYTETKEAQNFGNKLSEDLAKLWERNYDDAADAGGGDACGGHLCWDWAKGFKDTAQKLKEKNPSKGVCDPSYRKFAAKPNVQGYVPVHWAMEICFGECSKKKCCVTIDDGFFEDGLVHDSETWPQRNDYPEVKPPHLTSGGDPANGAGRPYPKPRKPMK